ncbi:MAG: hypothetical protein J07HQW2_00624 [Haloquadratum walsbyi J07HQW2]|uniref:Uncharacterized protein n=1 Tax=Haloquadratum walsbyi J07HQW2 TaxID=1238425 RepID=U1NBD0_9EURY|nr:MAG: hypothetical protein J07HQW2_00624 [Haloquadratum walsbyi J07HQW2]
MIGGLDSVVNEVLPFLSNHSIFDDLFISVGCLMYHRHIYIYYAALCIIIQMT